MLFHHLNAQNSGVDIEQIVCSLSEPVQIEPLKSAWRQIVDRHDVLKTSFQWQDRDEPCQHVHRTVEPPFDVTDMSQLSSSTQQHELEQWLHHDRITGFQLNEAPLFRLNLFRMAENEWTLVWTLHHAILDGRSFPIVLSEVFRTYDAQLRGEGVDLPAVRPYSDYIEFLSSVDVSQAERYWRGVLKDFAGATPLSALEERGGGDGHAEEHLQLSASASKALAELASRERFTVNNAVQAAWAVVLSRYSGTSDIVFGSTRACRGFLPRAGSMVGTFINTLPVRVKVQSEHSSFELLRQIRASQIEVRDYEHTPLTRIQSWSDLAPGSSLFESILVFDHAPLNDQMKSSYLKWDTRTVHLREHTNFPITLYANSDPELTLRIAYDRSRFGQANIQRALVHLRTILEELASGADQKTSQLPMLTDAERHELIQVWNNTATDYPHHQRIHDAVEAQTRRTPDAVAAVFRDEKITYKELNRRADQLSGFLTGLGVKPQSRVGIYMHRSLDMLVAMLAVLKAGGAYVPLDPSYPADRIQFIVDDSQAAVILTEESLSAKIQAGNAKIVALDKEWNAAAALQPVHPPMFGSDQVAYVLYTSGSTGKPKGVMVDASQRAELLRGDGSEAGNRSGSVAGGDQYFIRYFGARTVLDLEPRLPRDPARRKQEFAGALAAAAPIAGPPHGLQPVLLRKRRKPRRGQVRIARGRSQVRRCTWLQRGLDSGTPLPCFRRIVRQPLRGERRAGDGHQERSNPGRQRGAASARSYPGGRGVGRGGPTLRRQSGRVVCVRLA